MMYGVEAAYFKRTDGLLAYYNAILTWWWDLFVNHNILQCGILLSNDQDLYNNLFVVVVVVFWIPNFKQEKSLAEKFRSQGGKY